MGLNLTNKGHRWKSIELFQIEGQMPKKDPFFDSGGGAQGDSVV